LVGRAARRAGGDGAPRAAAAQAAPERLRPWPAIFPEHPDLRGRAVTAPRLRVAQRRDADVRHRLSALGELVSEVGGDRPGLEVAVGDVPPQAALRQRSPVLSPLRPTPP